MPIYTIYSSEDKGYSRRDWSRVCDAIQTHDYNGVYEILQKPCVDIHSEFLMLTPLYDAVKLGSVPFVTIFLKMGANPNAFDELHNEHENWRGSILDTAVALYIKAVEKKEVEQSSQRLEIIRLLLTHGAKELPNLSGETPLHQAVKAGNIELIRLLTTHGFNPWRRCQNFYGRLQDSPNTLANKKENVKDIQAAFGFVLQYARIKWWLEQGFEARPPLPKDMTCLIWSMLGRECDDKYRAYATLEGCSSSKNPILQAAQNNDVCALKKAIDDGYVYYCIQQKPGNCWKERIKTPMYHAVCHDNVEMATLLIQIGVPMDDFGEEGMHLYQYDEMKKKCSKAMSELFQQEKQKQLNIFIEEVRKLPNQSNFRRQPRSVPKPQAPSLPSAQSLMETYASHSGYLSLRYWSFFLGDWTNKQMIADMKQQTKNNPGGASEATMRHYQLI